MGGVAIAIASTAAESTVAGVLALENAHRVVLIGAVVLAVAIMSLLFALGLRTEVPATAAAHCRTSSGWRSASTAETRVRPVPKQNTSTRAGQRETAYANCSSERE